MKIVALFVERHLAVGPNEHCFLQDLAWAWRWFTVETGVQKPEEWLRDLVLEHGVELEEPAKGQSWRGWRVHGVGLNSEMTKRYAKYRIERLGLGVYKEWRMQ